MDFRTLQCVLLIDGLLVGMTADGVVHSGVGTSAAFYIPPFKVDAPCADVIGSADDLANAILTDEDQ